MKISLAGIGHAYARLAPRERMFVQLAASALAATVLYGIVSSVESAKESLRQKIAAKERQLQQVQELRQTYLQLRQQTDLLTSHFSNRPKDFSLFSFLEGAGTKTVTREKILAMAPSSKTIGTEFVEESVEIRLAGVSLSQVTGLFYEIDNAPIPLRVSRIQMKKRYNDPHNFDVTLVVSSIKSA